MPQDKPETFRRVDPVPVIHPFLLAVFPVLGLYAHNAALTDPAVLLRPMVWAGLGAMVLWFVLALVLRSVHRASAATAVLVLALLPGWHFLLAIAPYAMRAAVALPAMGPAVGYGLLGMLGLVGLCVALRRRGLPWRKAAVILVVVSFGAPFAARLLFLPSPGGVLAWCGAAYLLATCGLLIFLQCLPQGHKGITRTMNWFALLIVILYAALAAYNRSQIAPIAPPPLEATADTAAAEEPLPEIYVIMLHGYPSIEMLAHDTGYNALPYWEEMRELGFVRIQDAFANYTNGSLAAASCLNLDYIDALAPAGAPLVQVLPDLHRATRSGAFLRELGYHEVVFATGVEATEPEPPDAAVLGPAGVLREFEVVLLSNSIFGHMAQAYARIRWDNPGYWRLAPQAACVRYAFDNLGTAPQDVAAGPRFVVANVPVPDPPFLLDAEGAPPQALAASSESSAAGRFRSLLSGQMNYVSASVAAACRTILETSETPPIIWVLSGDGYGPAASIGTKPPAPLYATTAFVYFPGARTPFPRSPVNALRYTLDEVFDTKLGLLEEKRLFQTGPLAGDFAPIPAAPGQPTTAEVPSAAPSTPPRSNRAPRTAPSPSGPPQNATD